MIKLLIEYRADVKSKSSSGATALDLLTVKNPAIEKYLKVGMDSPKNRRLKTESRFKRFSMGSENFFKPEAVTDEIQEIKNKFSPSKKKSSEFLNVEEISHKKNRSFSEIFEVNQVDEQNNFFLKNLKLEERRLKKIEIKLDILAKEKVIQQNKIETFKKKFSFKKNNESQINQHENDDQLIVSQNFIDEETISTREMVPINFKSGKLELLDELGKGAYGTVHVTNIFHFSLFIFYFILFFHFSFFIFYYFLFE